MNPIPDRKKKLKTPERSLKNARNWYRRKKGIPEDAPLNTRAEPFNAKRRGTGNEERKVSMPAKAWKLLDEVRRDKTRGEFIQDAVKTEAILSGMV